MAVTRYLLTELVLVIFIPQETTQAPRSHLQRCLQIYNRLHSSSTTHKYIAHRPGNVAMPEASGFIDTQDAY